MPRKFDAQRLDAHKLMPMILDAWEIRCPKKRIDAQEIRCLGN